MQHVKRFAFDVSWVLVSSMVNLGLGFALRIILARWLGSFDLGLYTMVLTVQELATLIAGFGISSAFTKYVAEYQHTKDRLLQTVSSAFIVSIVFGLVGGVLLYFLSGTVAGMFDMPQLTRLLGILAISLPFSMLLQAELGLLNGLRSMKNYACLMIMRSCLMILFIIIFDWLGLGFEGTEFSILLSVAGPCMFGLYFSRKYFHPTFQGLFNNARELILFGGQVLGANAVNLIANHADIVMIGYYLDATKVGYYSIAVNLSMFFMIIPHAIQKISYPATAEYWYKNDHHSLQEMIDRSMKYCACILFPLGLCLGFFAEEIITIIFGGEFIYSVSPFLILLIVRVLRGSTIAPVGVAFAGRGRPDVGLKIDAISTVLNIGLNIVLIPRLGIVGAAVATTASLLVGTVIYIALLPRMLGVKIDARWYGWTIGLTCIAVAIFWIGKQFVNSYIVGSVTIAAYIILILRVFLTKEDRAFFRSLGNSVLGKIKK